MFQSIVQPVGCSSSTSPFYRFNENIVDPLEGILQEMAATIHSLITRHSAHICQSDGPSAIDHSESVSSCSKKMVLLKGYSSTHPSDCHNLYETSGNLHEISSPSCHSNYHQEASPCQRQELVYGQVVQDNEAVASKYGFSDGGHSQQEEGRVQVMTSSMIDQKSKRLKSQTVSDERTTDTFEGFLDEMRDTLKVWSSRHKCLSLKHVKLSSKGSSTLHVNLDQPAKNQEMRSMCNQQAFEESLYNEQVTKDVSGATSGVSNLQSHSRVEVSNVAAYQNPYRTADSLDIKHKPKKYTPKNDDKSASSSAGGYELEESPDWLPYGWITEVKRRANGTRAGSKVKHYFDPKSKRRFRSRKEVFCFLSTGKAGRYKPKSKALCTKGDKNEAIASSVQPTRPRQLLPRLPVFVPYHNFSSMPSLQPLAYPPSGFFNGFSLPFQSSEVHRFEHRFDFASQRARMEKWCTELHSTGSGPCASRGSMPRSPFDSDEANSSQQGFKSGIKTHLAQGDSNVHSRNSDGRMWQHQLSALTCFKKWTPFSSSLEALEKFKNNNFHSNDKFVGKGDTYRFGFAPAKFKRAKPEKKAALEVLGRLICQQGLSKMQRRFDG